MLRGFLPPPKPLSSSSTKSTSPKTSSSNTVLAAIQNTLKKQTPRTRASSSPAQIDRSQGNGNAYTVKDLRSIYSALLKEIEVATAELDKYNNRGSKSTSHSPSPSPSKAQQNETETLVIEHLRKLGEVVIYGEQNTSTLRTSSTTSSASSASLFDYFCEKNMLALLVDIARFTGPPSGTSAMASANVKSQVIQTVSILIQNVRNETSLYYLLSNNYINELISLPIDALPFESLDDLLPTYISFLKTLALRLSSNPTLFQFFIESNSGTDFPLFKAAVVAASSKYAATDSFFRITALNIVVNLCKISHDAIRRVIGNSVEEQVVLLGNLTGRLCGQVDFIVDATAAAADNSISNSNDSSAKARISDMIGELQDQVLFINDLLMCGVRGVNVRVCEGFLREVVFGKLLKGIVVNSGDELSSVNDEEKERSSDKLSHQAPSLPSFPGKIIDKREKSSAAVQYRIRWNGDNDDGSSDEWFSIGDMMREYPEAVLLYEGEVVKGGKKEVNTTMKQAKTKTKTTTKTAHVSSQADAEIQVSLFIMSQFFLTFEYKPLLRMLAIALLHPVSPCLPSTTSSSDSAGGGGEESEYVITPGLHCIIQNRWFMKSPSSSSSIASIDNKDISETETETDKVLSQKNPYRTSLLSLLFGAHGHSKFLPSSMLLQSILECGAIGNGILCDLKVIPLQAGCGKRRSGGGRVRSPDYHPLTVQTGDGSGSGNDGSDASASASASASVSASASYYVRKNTNTSSNFSLSPNSQSPPPPQQAIAGDDSSSEDFVEAISAFISKAFTHSHSPSQSLSPSLLASNSLESVGSLCLSLLTRIHRSQTTSPTQQTTLTNHLLTALITHRQTLSTQCLTYMTSKEIAPIFIDLFEEQIKLRYAPNGTFNAGLVFSLVRFGALALRDSSEFLVGLNKGREGRSEKSEVIGRCRFAIKCYLQVRGLCESLGEGCVVAADVNVNGNSGSSDIASSETNESPRSGNASTSTSSVVDNDPTGSGSGTGSGLESSFKFSTNDICDDEIMSIAELGRSELVGVEVNLEGRTIFRCFPLSEVSHDHNHSLSNNSNNKNKKGTINSASDAVDVMDGKPVGNELYLVVDTSMFYLAEPEEGANGGEVTKVACNCPMRNIVATRVDGLWLHVSLRCTGYMGGMPNSDSIGIGLGLGVGDGRKQASSTSAFKTINIALCFDTAETVLIVREHYEKCRTILRRRSMEQVAHLFKKSNGTEISARQVNKRR